MTQAKNKGSQGIGFFQKYLTLWVLPKNQKDLLLPVLLIGCCRCHIFIRTKIRCGLGHGGWCADGSTYYVGSSQNSEQYQRVVPCRKRPVNELKYGIFRFSTADKSLI